MVNFPTNYTPSGASMPTRATRRVVPSSPADKRETYSQDRRLGKDRRGRANTQAVMDRRSGSERRRSTINFSV